MRAISVAILVALLNGTAGAESISIRGAYAWISPGGRSAAAYFELENRCDTSQVIVAASTTDAAYAFLHGHSVDAAGTARMFALEDGLSVSADSSTTFEPGGFHVMFMGLFGKPAIGDTIVFNLLLANQQEIEVQAVVRPRGNRRGLTIDSLSTGGEDHFLTRQRHRVSAFTAISPGHTS